MKREGLKTFRCEATRRISGQNRDLDAAFAVVHINSNNLGRVKVQLSRRTNHNTNKELGFCVSVYKNSI